MDFIVAVSHPLSQRHTVSGIRQALCDDSNNLSKGAACKPAMLLLVDRHTPRTKRERETET